MKTNTYTVFKALESGAKTPTELMEITGLEYPTIKNCIQLLRKRGVEIETVYSGRASCLYRIISIPADFWDKPINRTEYLLEYLKKHKTISSNDTKLLKGTRVASVIKFLINEGHKFEITTNPKDGRQRLYRLIDEDIEPNAEQLEIPETEITVDVPEHYKVDPRYIEKRDKRLQVLVQQSIFDKLKNRATSEGVSVNEVINSIFIEAFSPEKTVKTKTIEETAENQSVTYWDMLKAKLEADYQVITNYGGYTDTGARAIASILEHMKNIENQEVKNND